MGELAWKHPPELRAGNELSEWLHALLPAVLGFKDHGGKRERSITRTPHSQPSREHPEHRGMGMLLVVQIPPLSPLPSHRPPEELADEGLRGER